MNQYQALNLEQGVRVKYGREIFTVDHYADFGTHREPVLISENGQRLVGTLFIAHLLSYANRPNSKVREPFNDPELNAADDRLATEADDACERAEPISIMEEAYTQPKATSLSGHDVLALQSAQTQLAAQLNPTQEDNPIPADELKLLEAYEADITV